LAYVNIFVQGDSFDTIDLTAKLADDWAHWGIASGAPTVRKLGGNLIGNLSLVGGGSASFGISPRLVSWSDGTPTLSGIDGKTTFNQGNTVGAGMKLNFPCSTSPRIAVLYCTYFNLADVKITGTINETIPVVSTNTGNLPPVYSQNKNALVYIYYQGDTDGNSLTVQMENYRQGNAGSFNFTLEAATVNLLDTVGDVFLWSTDIPSGNDVWLRPFSPGSAVINSLAEQAFYFGQQVGYFASMVAIAAQLSEISSASSQTKESVGDALQSVDITQQGTYTKNNSVIIISSAAQLLGLKQSLSAIKSLFSAITNRSATKAQSTSIKANIVSVVQLGNTRQFDTPSRLSNNDVSQAQALRRLGASSRLSITALAQLTGIKGTLSGYGSKSSTVLTSIKISEEGSYSKSVGVVIISSASQALEIRQSLSGSKSAQGILVQQSRLSGLDTYTRKAIVNSLQKLGINVGITYNTTPGAIVVVTDPCSGQSTDLTIIPFGSRFENETIDFSLCGGEDRFDMMRNDLLTSLKAKGLL